MNTAQPLILPKVHFLQARQLLVIPDDRIQHIRYQSQFDFMCHCQKGMHTLMRNEYLHNIIVPGVSRRLCYS